MNDSDYKKYLDDLNKAHNNKSRYKCKACTYIRIGLIFSSGFLMHCLILRIKKDNKLAYDTLDPRIYKNKILTSLFVLGIVCYYFSFRSLIKELNN